jgi:hypothetical protein
MCIQEEHQLCFEPMFDFAVVLCDDPNPLLSGPRCKVFLDSFEQAFNIAVVLRDDSNPARSGLLSEAFSDNIQNLLDH